MMVVLRWRQPAPNIRLQWRGRDRTQEASRVLDSNTPLAGVIGPPGPAGTTTSSTLSVPSNQAVVNPDLNFDVIELATHAVNVTFGVPIGSPTQNQKLIIKIRDNGTPINISWNPIYFSAGPAFVSTTSQNKLHSFGFMYDSTVSKWALLAAAKEP